MSEHNDGADGSGPTGGDSPTERPEDDRTAGESSDRESSGSDDEHPGVLGTGPSEDPVPQPVEPGSPTLENAVFVLLGVASMIALIVHLVSLL